MQNHAITLYYFISAVPGIGLWGGSRRLEASQSLKSILKKWDHFPASTVMSPAAVCPAQECTWATYRANTETGSHTHTGMTPVAVRRLQLWKTVSLALKVL